MSELTNVPRLVHFHLRELTKIINLTCRHAEPDFKYHHQSRAPWAIFEETSTTCSLFSSCRHPVEALCSWTCVVTVTTRGCPKTRIPRRKKREIESLAERSVTCVSITKNKLAVSYHTSVCVKIISTLHKNHLCWLRKLGEAERAS